MIVTDEMVNRFLAWRLPEDFAPDCGISFDGRKADQWNPGGKGWPVGTNLLTAIQARAMLEHIFAVSERVAPHYTVEQLESWQQSFENLRREFHRQGNHDGQSGCEFALEAIRLYQSTPSATRPIQAHSKTEYKRLKAQGADVLPPSDKREQAKPVAWRWVWMTDPNDGWTYTDTPPLYPRKQHIEPLYTTPSAMGTLGIAKLAHKAEFTLGQRDMEFADRDFWRARACYFAEEILRLAGDEYVSSPTACKQGRKDCEGFGRCHHGCV